MSGMSNHPFWRAFRWSMLLMFILGVFWYTLWVQSGAPQRQQWIDQDNRVKLIYEMSHEGEGK